MNDNKTENKIEAFDGIIAHPSLDIQEKVLFMGFRYRVKLNKDDNIFVVANNGNLRTMNDNSIHIGDKLFCIESRTRKLARIDEKWSINSLQNFINDYQSLNTQINRKGIFEDLLKRAKKYIELEREIDYYLLVAWILGTYFTPAFYSYSFLHIKAPKRSGKSQCLNFLMQLCFNAVKARPSLAALSDTVDALRGTYLIDQADSLSMKGKEELLDILADSYKKSGGKRRVVSFDKRKGRETLEFETYGPKAFASVKELPEDLRDRCLVVPLIRSQSNFPDPDDGNENWREIRGSIYQVLLTEYELISTLYSVKKIHYRESKEILGRSLELWLPFEVVLECFGITEKIDEAKKRFLSQYGFTEYEPSEIEEEVINTVLLKLEDETAAILTPREISELMDPEVFNPSDTPKQRASKVGWTIKKFNLSTEKKPRTKEGVRYLFEKVKVEGIKKSYFKTITEPTPPTLQANDTIDVEQIQM